MKNLWVIDLPALQWNLWKCQVPVSTIVQRTELNQLREWRGEYDSCQGTKASSHDQIAHKRRGEMFLRKTSNDPDLGWVSEILGPVVQVHGSVAMTSAATAKFIRGSGNWPTTTRAYWRWPECRLR